MKLISLKKNSRIVSFWTNLVFREETRICPGELLVNTKICVNRNMRVNGGRTTRKYTVLIRLMNLTYLYVDPDELDVYFTDKI